MASVSITHIIGNVGGDPEVRYMPNGDAVANFSIATTDSWKDKQGQKQEKTQWHRIVAYRKLGEIVESYVKKGSSVYIQGKLEYTTYTDKQGVEKYSTQIVANELRLLDKRTDSPAKEESKSNGYQKQPMADSVEDMESDIPFS